MARKRTETFLRSINLIYDAGSPDAVSHFYPTAKTVPLLNAILGNDSDRSTFVIAPYGSGKSLTAAYALHLIENTPTAGAALMPVVEKFAKLDSELATFSEMRIEKGQHQHGLVLALHGGLDNLPHALKEAALLSIKRIGLASKAASLRNKECNSSDEVAEFLTALREFCVKQKLDRIAILWDEFGKHLEGLISEGRTSDLIAVQQLSEYVSRSKKIPATLSLFMHQGLMRYASNLPSSARTEWSKIGGRFKSIQYVDTSREIYQLLAKIIDELRVEKAPRKPYAELAKKCDSLGIFRDFKTTELRELLEAAYPLEPVSFYLLPRISSRVAQNERTLFSFLYEQDLSDEISPDGIYDYFSNEMHADTSVGGTSKHWLQTESAIGKCAGDVPSETVLKCACLLGMGLAGERAQVSKKYLAFAASGFESNTVADKTVKSLIGNNLLLYRKHTDSVSVWHGTDYDLRGKVDERKNLLRNDFDYIHFLGKEAPPRPWSPTRYNVDNHVRRFFPGGYASLDALSSEDVLSLVQDGRYLDGKIIYCILRDDAEIKAAKKIAKSILDPRIIIIIPEEKSPVFDAALEVKALLDLSHDYQFISQDPLLPVELHQMLDDSRSYLQKMLDRLTSPFGAPTLYFKGKRHSARTAACFREVLSNVMAEKFTLSPVIKNELLVRHQVSRPIQNARKKLIYGTLEQAGKKVEFGFTETEINTPQASIYRSVLVNTGLYVPGKCKFAKPEHLQDQGLKAIWSLLESFFKDSGEKDLRELLNKLQLPPYGVRAGVLPVLFAAGYKAFASSVVLKKEGVYVEDINSIIIENICTNPELYSLVVIKIDAAKRRYLEQLSNLFAYGEIKEEAFDEPKGELLRHCYESLLKWREALPVAALRGKGVSPQAAEFQEILRIMPSPEILFFEDLPNALGCNGRQATVDTAKMVVDELINIISIYQRDVEELLRETFSQENATEKDSLVDIIQEWISIFPAEVQTDAFDFVGKRFCEIILNHKDSDERLIDAIALILVGKGLIHWDDTTFLRFKNKLSEQTVRMQNQFLNFQSAEDYEGNISKLLSFQARSLFEQCARNMGVKDARAIFKKIMESK
ncbi:MAG: hypothetical protein H8E68_00375 [Kiritimatiellaeota bacterium]|nr:hypothetical protein [Kiritimatiellota bacterium]